MGAKLKELGETFVGLPFLVEVEEADEELESISLIKEEDDIVTQMANVGMTDESMGEDSEKNESKGKGMATK
eukprot:10888412-Karenia_brevis.AAC.1